MMTRLRELLAKLGPGAQKGVGPAVADPLADKMRGVKWSATEDDRSAERYLSEDKDGAPLAEIMASPYLGRSGEPIEY